MDGHTSFDEYRMSDAMWILLEPLLPKYERSCKGGRSRADLRRIADAIFYRIRVGSPRTNPDIKPFQKSRFRKHPKKQDLRSSGPVQWGCSECAA
jgi:hypothetical protein